MCICQAFGHSHRSQSTSQEEDKNRFGQLRMGNFHQNEDVNSTEVSYLDEDECLNAASLTQQYVIIYQPPTTTQYNKKINSKLPKIHA